MVKYKAGVLGRHMGHAQEIQAQVKDLEISAVVDKSFLQGSEVPSVSWHLNKCSFCAPIWIKVLLYIYIYIYKVQK